MASNGNVSSDSLNIPRPPPAKKPTSTGRMLPRLRSSLIKAKTNSTVKDTKSWSTDASDSDVSPKIPIVKALAGASTQDHAPKASTSHADLRRSSSMEIIEDNPNPSTVPALTNLAPSTRLQELLHRVDEKNSEFRKLNKEVQKALRELSELRKAVTEELAKLEPSAETDRLTQEFARVMSNSKETKGLKKQKREPREKKSNKGEVSQRTVKQREVDRQLALTGSSVANKVSPFSESRPTLFDSYTLGRPVQRSIQWEIQKQSEPLTHLGSKEPARTTIFPDPIFRTQSPRNPKTVDPPNEYWRLGDATKPLPSSHLGLSSNCLLISQLPPGRCSIKELIAWFQLFGPLMAVKHDGVSTAVLQFRDLIGAWRAFNCPYPAWGDPDVRARFVARSAMDNNSKAGLPNQKRLTIPLIGIRGPNDIVKGQPSSGRVTRKRTREAAENDETDSDEPSAAGGPKPNQPGITLQHSLDRAKSLVTINVDGTEYIVVDSDIEDPPPPHVKVEEDEEGSDGTSDSEEESDRDGARAQRVQKVTRQTRSQTTQMKYAPENESSNSESESD